jgi:anaerobic C4-dicarboxylate transporter
LSTNNSVVASPFAKTTIVARILYPTAARFVRHLEMCMPSKLVRIMKMKIGMRNVVIIMNLGKKSKYQLRKSKQNTS